MRVRVIGAGVTGLAVAIELASAGVEVDVFDRGASLGRDASSWLAGGMLAPFCEGEAAPEVLTVAGRSAADWWQAHVPDVHRRGTLVLAAARDGADLARFARLTQQHDTVTEAQIDTLEPALAGRFRRGLFFRDEAHLDPRRALCALHDGLRDKRVRFHFGKDGLGQNGVSIDCRGWAAHDVLPDLRPVKGEMIVLRSADITLSRPVRLLHPRLPLYVVPRGDGRFMIGATMLESSDRHRVSARAVAGLINAAYSLHPAFGEAELVEYGADIRPAFPNNIPRIQRIGDTIHVNGVFRHGFLLAPDLARKVRQMVLPDTQTGDQA
jgi:glycine oxidase